MNENEEYPEFPQQIAEPPNIQDRLDQISLFLQYIEHLDPYKNVVDKVKSIGYIELSHMPGHIQMDGAIMTFFKRGQVQ